MNSSLDKNITETHYGQYPAAHYINKQSIKVFVPIESSDEQLEREIKQEQDAVAKLLEEHAELVNHRDQLAEQIKLLEEQLSKS